MKNWKTDTDDSGVLWLCLDKAESKANVLSSDVFYELDDILEPLAKDPPKGLVLWSGKNRSFVMGADIKEIDGIESPERAYELTRLGQQLLDKVEALKCPTVAVINGHCLGGGFELSLALDYRIALQGEQKIIGLPEVKLGLHPGFGGTVRAIQTAGVRAGMQLMLTGSSIAPGKAKALGFIDKISSEDDWRNDAVALIGSAPPKQRAPFLDRLLSTPIGRPFVRNMLLKQVSGKARKEHYPAPYAMIELWETHAASPTTGYEAEARSFAKLVCS
jgi:3-hydroxyacyl-CoA dehydrogenase/enoyl-CoA hydratase/3-hydroxybutyryl-CoA epimerase